MSATDDVARMLTLVPWLLERPGASLQETADWFGVSPAVIRRDLSHLDFCGLPGLGGGDLFDVTLVEDRIVVTMADELRRPLRPTPAEALRLVLTAGAAEAVLADEVPALRSAIDKVRDALGIPASAVEIIAPTGPRTVGQVRDAIRRHRRLRLQYQGRADDAPTTRDVDPWAVQVVAGAWYLQGYDHGVGDLRTFRLDRVAACEILDVPVEAAVPEDLPPPRYVPGPDDVEVVLETSAAGRWVADAVDAEQQEELDGGGLRLRLRTDAPSWVAGLVLMAGGHARVVSPSELAECAVDGARAALQRYPDED